ncbi:unnamed protein product, partial [marine sediment metagenome]
VGIDLGGTNIKIGCFDSKLNLICKTSEAIKADMGPQVVVDKIAQTTEKLLADNSLSFEQIEAVGIGAPGPSNITEGVIIAAPNLPKFRNTPLRWSWLRHRLRRSPFVRRRTFCHPGI